MLFDPLTGVGELETCRYGFEAIGALQSPCQGIFIIPQGITGPLAEQRCSLEVLVWKTVKMPPFSARPHSLHSLLEGGEHGSGLGVSPHPL